MEEDTVAPSPNPSPSNVIDMVTQRALLNVSSTYDNKEQDPDKAAKAVQLSRTTGVPAAVIHEDQDRFMHEGKQALAKGIVSSNPYIQDYIMAHPLAAKVSSDDWGPMDEAMNTGLKFATKSILQATAEGFKKHTDYEQFEGEMKEFDNLLARNSTFIPLSNIFYEQVLRNDVHDIGKAFHTISGLFGAVAGGLGEALYQTGAPDWFQKHIPIGDPLLTGEAGKKRLTADILAGLQTTLSGQEGPAGPGIKPRADALKQFRMDVTEEIKKAITITDANGRVYPPQLIKPYLEAGEEPPVGVHPEIDKVKAEQSKLDAKWLKEFDSAFQKTATQGRSPEMSELAIRQVVGDQAIELDAGAIRKIYGDKPPTLEDGLLGWIPDLGDKLRVAEATGGDIEVPLASWIARTDPEVKRELGDFIRVRPEGISPAEKEFYKAYDEAVKSPMVEGFHGSRHELEGFSSEKIGTGQGAQTYGHGHYIAQAKDVAETYRTAGQMRPMRYKYNVNGKEVSAEGIDTYDNAFTPEAAAAFRMHQASGDRNRAMIAQEDRMARLDRLEQEGKLPEDVDHNPEFDREVVNILREGDIKEIEPPKGNLYRIRINREPEEFLDWDKPLAEQPPQIQEAVRKAAGTDSKVREFWDELTTGGMRDIRRGLATKGEATGQGAYTALGRLLGDEKKASKALSEAGIAGIKYLDQFSRGKVKADFELEIKALEAKIAESGEKFGPLRNQLQELLAQQVSAPEKQTSNFVVFNDKDLQILERNGQPLSSGDHIVDGIRSAAGLDSMFDPARLQKLNLERKATAADETGASHEFDLKDVDGNRIGNLSIDETDGGKKLNIGFIGAGPSIGPEGFQRTIHTPGFLGPRIIRDILTQIKNEFPNAEKLSGVRVSGAREEFANRTTTKPEDVTVSISLKSPSALSTAELARLGEQIFQMLREPEEARPVGEWRGFGADVEGYIHPTELYTQHQQQIAAEVGRIIDRIAPKAVNVIETGAIRDAKTQAPAFGMYLRNSERATDSLILWSLNAENPKDIVRHEGLHHLRQMGFLTDKEWSVLEAASKKNRWMERYGINERYKAWPGVDLTEEAVAAAFERYRVNPSSIDSSVHPIMQKIRELLDNIQYALKQILGTLNENDVFQRIESGKVGSREPMMRTSGEVTRAPSVKEPELPQAGTTRMEDRKPITGKAINLSEKAMNSILQAIEDRAEADWQAQKDKLEKMELKRQTREWKDNTLALRSEVEKEVYQRADIGADQLLRKGMLDGIRVKGKIPKIDPQFLTPAQRARLPKDYFGKANDPNSFNIDDFARLFKFDSGDALVERLAMLEEGRKQSGLEGKAFIDRLVKDTTELRMEEKYGDNKANAIQEARDKFVGDKDLRVIHETILGVMEAIGGEKTITKEKLEQGILEAFNNKIASQVKAKKDLRDSGKLDKAATIELFVNKNPAGWLSNKMAQYRAIYDHGLSTKLEKEWNKFQDTLSGLKSRSSDTMDQGYRNIIHDLMIRLGEEPKRIPGDLQDSMAKFNEGADTLATFKLSVYDKTWGMDDLQVPEFLLAENFSKPLDELTVEEFRGVKSTIDALAKKGRAVHTFEVEGDKMEKAKAIDMLIEGVTRFPYKPHEATPSRSSKLMKLPRAYLAASTNFETFARRMDQQDPYGPWMRMLMYPLARAANTKDVLVRDAARQLAKVGPIHNFNKLLESPPLGIKVTNFTVDNLQTMIHNMGNEHQWEHFARGWGADPQVLKQWVFTQAARLDTIEKDWGKQLFERAQKMGDEVWDHTFQKAQAEYVDIYGNFPEKIELKPIQTPYGEAKGWYHPQIPDAKQKVIFDKDGKEISKQSAKQGEPSLYDSNDNFHARTFNGYTKKRTGAFYPMSLDSNMIPVRLTQMLHDIAFRKTLIEAEKVLGDKRLQNAVSHHYGDEYAKGFMPYLRGIAGQEGIPSEVMGDVMRLSEFLRQNVISSYIGFNPYTALKHGPGALAMSMLQVGAFPFLRYRRPGALSEAAPKAWLESAKDLYGHQMDMNLTNQEFVDKWSEEVGRRRRFWQETIGGQTKLNTNQAGMFSRENIIEKGSWLVAQSDMFSVKPTWLAAYRDAMLDTKNNHELSVSVADAAVRLQHGSTAVTNLPAIVRSMGKNPLGGWLTSIFGFWGTIMQRRIEMAHQIADTYRMDISDKQFGQMYKNSAEILLKAMIYVVWPAMVEEAVTGLTTDDRRGWGAHIFDAAIHGLGASGIGIREISQLFRGHESFGLITSVLHDTSKTLRSLAKGEEIFSRKNAGETVQNVITTFGQATGKAPRAFGSAARYGLDLFTEQQQPPETIGELGRGITRGNPRARIIK